MGDTIPPMFRIQGPFHILWQLNIMHVLLKFQVEVFKQ